MEYLQMYHLLILQLEMYNDSMKQLCLESFALKSSLVQHRLTQRLESITCLMF